MPLPTTGEYLVDVVGESHYQQNLSAICGPRTEDGEYREVRARLVLDNNNPHDANAVAIEIDSRQVGHLSRQNAVAFRRWLESPAGRTAPYTCPAVIIGGWKRGSEDIGSYGVVLDVAIPGVEMRDDPPWDPREDDEDEGGDIEIVIEYEPRQTTPAKSAYASPPASKGGGIPSWVWVLVMVGAVALIMRGC